MLLHVSLNPRLLQNSFDWQDIELHTSQGGQIRHSCGHLSGE